MATDFDGMSHERIYDVVQTGAPTTVSSAASQLAALNTTISGHLDTLDQLSRSMSDAWPDENGQNFRSTLSHTVGYLRELQASHVVTASSSITQVMSASHEKLSHTQATIPPPPAVPVATQEKSLTKGYADNHGASNAGLAAASQRLMAGKADDAKAVQLAKALANTYLVEKAKLTAPPAAPKGPSGNGSGAGSTASASGGASSNHATASYSSTTGSGAGAAGSSGGGSSSGGSYSTGGGHPAAFTLDQQGGSGGTGGAAAGGGYGSDGGHAGSNQFGTLLDPGSQNSPLYDAHGNVIGGATGFDGSSASSVHGVLGAGASNGGSGSGFDASALGVTAVGGGLAAAGVVAARRAAAQRASQAALLKEQLSEEELAANGGGNLSASQLAAINAQRNGVLAVGTRAGLMNGERTMFAGQQPGLPSSTAAMTAEEQALAAGQRTVPGQLGGSPATAAGTGSPRTGMPFAGGGVVGGAERVTWLVEDRDLFSADPGVRAIIED
jgi:hypothetical protein